MPKVTEVSVLDNWTLSLDHFYTIVKSTLGELSSSGRYQIQAQAIPLDISEDYEWFSRGLLNAAFDVALDPIPVSDNISAGLQLKTSLSSQYISFISTALSLVETKELDPKIIDMIEKLEVDLENLSEKEARLQKKLDQKWASWSTGKGINIADAAQYVHWSQGQVESFKLIQIRNDLLLRVARITGLRDTKYEDLAQKELLVALKNSQSPSATMRYPRFEDDEYPDEEQEKFGPVYLAGLPAHESSLFTNQYLMRPKMGFKKIATSNFGSFNSTITSESVSNESITTDWKASGSAGYGPFKVKASVSSHEFIREDFSHVKSMTVSAESLMAIPYDANTWFNPEIFDNEVIKENASLFARWLGEKGSLHVFPTHLIICRGFKVTFSSSQNWEYDYEKDFKTSGGGSASVFGIKFGANASYQKHIERQKIERRGHDLILDDGPENIRIIGYHTVTNESIDDFWINNEFLTHEN